MGANVKVHDGPVKTFGFHCRTGASARSFGNDRLRRLIAQPK